MLVGRITGVQGCHMERDHSALSTAMEKEGQEYLRLQLYTHEIYNSLSHNAKIYENAIRTTLTRGIIHKGTTVNRNLKKIVVSKVKITLLGHGNEDGMLLSLRCQMISQIHVVL